MSLNTAHANGGVLIFNGEVILLYCDSVEMKFEGLDAKEFHGSKKGRLYLTSHRMIFTNTNPKDRLGSFSFPFFTMSSLQLEQPVFGANYIKGKVKAQPNGNWTGHAEFQLRFMKGGAIEYGQAMLQAAKLARYRPEEPPPYMAPTGPFYEAAPPAYSYNPQPGGYYGFIPPTDVFPGAPPPNSVYMTDMPPPYPGIGMVPPGYGAPPQPGFGAPQQPGYSPPSQQQGYGAPPQPGFYGIVPPQGGKSQEAAQSAYYDPNNPGLAYAPPTTNQGMTNGFHSYPPPSAPPDPNYPPTYDEATKKGQ